jgi:hypothetical protein
MLMALVIRNSQSHNNSSLAKESDKAGTPDKMAVDPQANNFQAIRFQPIEPIDVGIAPIHLSSNSDLKREPIDWSPLENTSSTNASLTSDSIAVSNDSDDAKNSSTRAEASSTPSFPPAPYLLAATGSTNISAKPETNSTPSMEETSAPLSSPDARPTTQALYDPSAHPTVAIGSPPEPSTSFALSENKPASFASTVSESIVDTGVRMTTRQLIDAYRTKQNPAYSAYASAPTKPIANNAVVNDSVARIPSNGGTPYAPIGNEISLTSTFPIADHPAQPKPNEYQPLFPYEQNAININSTGFPAISTDSQSKPVRRPNLNGLNRYQEQPTQQPAYAPYQSMAPAQGANSVGYPPSN